MCQCLLLSYGLIYGVIMKRMILILILSLLASFSASARTKYQFALKASNPNLNTKVNHYLNFIETSLSAGIRFGTNRAIQVKFQKFQGEKLTLNCDDKYLDNFSYPNIFADTIILNSDILRLINDGMISQRNKHCSYNGLIIKSIENSIVKTKHGDDLSLPYSDQMKRKVWKCRDQLKREEKDQHIFRPIKGCQEIVKRDNRKKSLKRLKYRREAQLLHNTDRDKIVVDPTTFSIEGLRPYNVCNRPHEPDLYTPIGNKPIKFLGYAITYMSPSFYPSQFGHVGERYIYCVGRRMVDVTFEHVQLNPNNEQEFKKKYYQYLDTSQDLSPFINAIMGKKYVRFVQNAASIKEYGSQQFAKNRDIIEVWLDVDPKTAYKSYMKSYKIYKQQKEYIKNMDVDGWPDYKVFSDNCTHPIREKLNDLGGEYAISDFDGMLPSFIYNFLKTKKVDRIILYPSQRTMRLLKMLNTGTSTAFENVTFLMDTANNSNEFVLIYPEYSGFTGFFMNRIASVINLASGLVETVWGVVTSPLSLFTDSDNVGVDRIGSGLKNSASSLTEFFGVARNRFPETTNWTEEELSYIKNIIPFKEPVVLEYLFTKFPDN